MKWRRVHQLSRVGENIGRSRKHAPHIDQGKQPDSVSVPEWFRPLGSPIFSFFPELGMADEGVMETRNGDDVPGVTGQGTRKEAALVVDEMGDDHFEDLHREPDGI